MITCLPVIFETPSVHTPKSNAVSQTHSSFIHNFCLNIKSRILNFPFPIYPQIVKWLLLYNINFFVVFMLVEYYFSFKALCLKHCRLGLIYQYFHECQSVKVGRCHNSLKTQPMNVKCLMTSFILIFNRNYFECILKKLSVQMFVHFT